MIFKKTSYPLTTNSAAKNGSPHTITSGLLRHSVSKFQKSIRGLFGNGCRFCHIFTPGLLCEYRTKQEKTA